MEIITQKESDNSFSENNYCSQRYTKSEAHCNKCGTPRYT